MITEPSWRKSSLSGASGGNCVEVAGHDGRILVRDSKDRGPVHHYPARDWLAFITIIKTGRDQT